MPDRKLLLLTDFLDKFASRQVTLMSGEEKEFRFLKNEEFLALSVMERARYLSRASQELESRQRILRDQLVILKKDAGQE